MGMAAAVYIRRKLRVRLMVVGMSQLNQALLHSTHHASCMPYCDSRVTYKAFLSGLAILGYVRLIFSDLVLFFV